MQTIKIYASREFPSQITHITHIQPVPCGGVVFAPSQRPLAKEYYWYH